MNIIGLQVMTILIVIMAFFSLYKAYVGPNAADRVVAINVISTKIATLIALLSVITDQEAFIDVSLIYSMMGFIATVCVSKYIERGKLY